MVGHKNRRFGDTQFVVLLPGFSIKLFHRATPAHLQLKNNEKLRSAGIAVATSIGVQNIGTGFGTAEMPLTHVLFGSYGSSQTPAVNYQMVSHLFQTEKKSKPLVI